MGDGTTTRHTFCRICESLCGLEVTLKGNEVVAIRPDDSHVATRGFACPKGLKQHRLYSSPDRLKYPMKRVGDGAKARWHRIPWEEALGEIGQKVRGIRGDHHPDALAMYVGTAAGFGVLHPVFAQGFMTGVGSASMFSSATQDCSNKFAVAHHVYGFPFTQPFPDIQHTQCMIIVGANPLVSKWSFLQVPNPSKHLKEMEARGTKIWIVDPRRTETAKVAGRHEFIRPGTDPFFYLAFLAELDAQNGVDRDFAMSHAEGLDTVLELARPWTPERSAEVTGIGAEVLREMVRDFRDASARKGGGAAFYSSTGVNMGGDGAISFWIQEVINLVSGNLDRRGGTLVGKGVIDFPRFGTKNGVLMRKERSRVGDFASVNDAFPGGILADEILTPGEKQIRGLFVTGGNPLLTMANSNRLRKAFSQLELLVCLDIHPSETAQIGHYMLPCTSPLERPDLPFIFPLMLGLQTRPYLQATRRVVEPEGEQRDEATIYLDLCRASGINLFDSAIAQRFFESAKRVHGWRNRKSASANGSSISQPALPQEFLLNLLLRVTGQQGFRSLLRKPHGVARPAHEPGSFLGKRVTTPNGKVQLAPDILVAQSAGLAERFETEKKELGNLRLISKRAVTTHNSWTHNLDEFVSGPRSTNYLYMHPADAAARAISEGDLVDVESATGKVRITVRYLEDLMPGAVALPHGWGHQASGQSVARKTTGVNVNVLAEDGPGGLERASGMARLTAIPVEVRLAEGPLEADSWTGLPEDCWSGVPSAS